MSDIFEIKTASVELKIGDKTFEMRDPKFIEKIKMKKEWETLAKLKDDMDQNDYILKAYDLNKKQIMAFIPEMTEEFIDDKIPSSALELLIAKIGEISEKKFGAVIEKTEKK